MKFLVLPFYQEEFEDADLYFELEKSQKGLSYGRKDLIDNKSCRLRTTPLILFMVLITYRGRNPIKVKALV